MAAAHCGFRWPAVSSRFMRARQAWNSARLGMAECERVLCERLVHACHGGLVGHFIRVTQTVLHQQLSGVGTLFVKLVTDRHAQQLLYRGIQVHRRVTL